MLGLQKMPMKISKIQLSKHFTRECKKKLFVFRYFCKETTDEILAE